jgi:hypothetical protein
VGKAFILAEKRFEDAWDEEICEVQKDKRLVQRM